MTPLLFGYLTGLSLIILIGPVLFVLLSTTLEQGRRAGLMVAFGIFVSDIIAVTLTLMGFAALFERAGFRQGVLLAGGILVLGLGLRYLLRPSLKVGAGATPATLAKAFVQGFLVNFVNPFVFMVWIGLITAATARFGEGAPVLFYLSGCLLGILTLDVLKVLLAKKLMGSLKPRRLKWVLRSSGVLMVLFSGRLFYGVFF